MDFFGYTALGPQNYIKDCLRCEYREPMNEEDVNQVLKQVENRSGTMSEPHTMRRGGLAGVDIRIQKPSPDVITIRTIDCYLGRVNGFAYGSFQKFVRMKRKGLVKPIGPLEIYRFPVTQSQEYGWFHQDAELTSTTWHQTSPRHPQPVSPNTLSLDLVRRNDKYASLF